MIFRKILMGLSATATLTATAPAYAGTDPFIGEVMLTANNFCPRNWAEANGQLLQIGQYQALFALLGTTYGGDGRTTFALPDLRGRAPVHFVGAYPRPGVKSGNLPAASPGPDAPSVRTTPTLAMRYCVALVGVFPPRS